MDHLITCFNEFISNPANVGIVFTSLIISLGAVYYFKKMKLNNKKRIITLYMHIFFILFPVVFFILTMSCNGGLCDESKIVVYSTALVLASAIIVAVVYLSKIYLILYGNGIREFKDENIMKLLEEHFEKNKIPRVYIIKKPEPVAFSTSSYDNSIFITIGMLEILTRKELKAVILHEAGHIKNNSAPWKLVALVGRIISPLRNFCTKCIEYEEKLADVFASEKQGTTRYLESARRKCRMFFEY